MKKNNLLVVVALLAMVTACPPPTPEKVVETVVVTKEVPVEVTKIVEVTKEVVKEVPRPLVEVRLSGWTASPEEENLLRASLYEFSVQHPDIIVKYEPITEAYWDKMLTMVAAGTEPDIYYMDIFQFPFYAEKGVMMPLDELMAKTETKREDFINTLIDAFTHEGVTYGIPKDFNTLALFYNKKMFADAGLAEPTDDWTWDDLKAAAKALSKPEENIFGFGVPPDPGRFPIFVFQNGSHIMTEDFTDTLLDSPEAIEAAEFYTSFRKEGIGAIPADVGVGWQGEAFGKGNFAMVLEGGWLIPYLTTHFPDTEFGAVMPPAGPKAEGNFIFTVAYVISKNCKNPEAAWEVINYLTGIENQTTVLRTGFALPSRKALLDDPYFDEHPVSATIFRGAEFGTPFMWGLHGSDVNEQISKALERIYLEGQAPAEALKEAAETLREIFRE